MHGARRHTLGKVFISNNSREPQKFFFVTNVLLVGILENALKKAISRQKRHIGRFWLLLTFLSTLKKLLTKTTFVRLLFLKLKQKKNMKKYFLKVFVTKLINALFWSQLFFRNIFSVLAL